MKAGQKLKEETEAEIIEYSSLDACQAHLQTRPASLGMALPILVWAALYQLAIKKMHSHALKPKLTEIPSP